VVVTINYRLGAFGFFYGNSSEANGNQGLWDQTMALEWSIKNIAAFGGNPKQITLFGESAGSISISYHIVSKASRNKFQNAIMQSGRNKSSHNIEI
jgi:carboxylesterase type B